MEIEKVRTEKVNFKKIFACPNGCVQFNESHIQRPEWLDIDLSRDERRECRKTSEDYNIYICPKCGAGKCIPKQLSFLDAITGWQQICLGGE